MILDNEVEVAILNQGGHFRKLGYADAIKGAVIKVKVEDLGKHSDIIVRCSCDECESEFTKKYRQIHTKKNYEGQLCNKCERKFTNKEAGSRLKHYTGEKHHNFNPNKKALQAYAYKVRRITEGNYVKNKDLINPSNHARTLCGVEGGYQLDHKVSIETGFRFGINPIVIGSTQNLEMLPWEANRAKW